MEDEISNDYIKRDKTSFDIGFLIESPCKHCFNKKDLPKCSENCKIIDKIQTILASSISCGNLRS